MIKTEVDKDVVEHLSDLLASGDIRSVKALMDDEKFELVLQEKANDLIPVVSYHFNKERMKNNPVTIRFLEKIVQQCAEKGNAKECLMEFLAQIESLEVAKFQTLLKPIQTTMLRVPERKAPLMQCVFNVIYSFINTLPMPNYQGFDNTSKLLLDCDENVQQISDNYNLIVGFYEPFVTDASGSQIIDMRIKNIRRVLLQALLQLLGYPMVYLDLEFNDKGSSVFRTLSSKIMNLIQKLQSDPLQLLIVVEDKELITVYEEKSIIKEFSSNEVKFSDLALSVFFYLVFNEKMWLSVPNVYSTLFIFQNGLTLAVTLLQHKEMLVLRKGLLLTKKVVEMVEVGSVHFSYLDGNIHKELITLLSNVAVFHDVEENRKLAVDLLKKHFNAFEPKAQYYILLNTTSLDQHPNLVGYLTTTLTSMVRESFTRHELKEYFTGKRLFDLLNIFCSLKKGAETDLIENKDQILSALNLIIFLTRRDRSNFSGIWNYVGSLSKSFLSPLKEGVDLSKAHFNLELKTLNESSKDEESSEIAVTVGGQELGNMSVEEKKGVIHSGLTVFDLIEHLLSRANECIEDKPSL